MLSSPAHLVASKSEFVFSNGVRECRFRPVAFFAHERKIAGIGTPPESGYSFAIDLFEEANPAIDASLVLEALIRFGLQKIRQRRFTFRLPALTIRLGDDISHDLKGFGPSIFKLAATNAGAIKVIVEHA